MAENIASRVGRLISGTANMVVDTVENMAPEMVMEEAIREVDRAIDDVRAELGAFYRSNTWPQDDWLKKTANMTIFQEKLRSR